MRFWYDDRQISLIAINHHIIGVDMIQIAMGIVCKPTLEQSVSEMLLAIMIFAEIEQVIRILFEELLDYAKHRLTNTIVLCRRFSKAVVQPQPIANSIAIFIF